MEITVYNPDEFRVPEILSAIDWPMDDMWKDKGQSTFTIYGEGFLVDDESEGEFVSRIAAAVWQANRQYCEIAVNATNLTQVPYVGHTRGQPDYAEWLRTQKESTTDG
jgi:hypothetical protein